jgi:hypothetical protein
MGIPRVRVVVSIGEIDENPRVLKVGPEWWPVGKVEAHSGDIARNVTVAIVSRRPEVSIFPGEFADGIELFRQLIIIIISARRFGGDSQQERGPG